MIYLIGPLANADLCAALNVKGEPARVQGRLHGGAGAGIIAGDWPVLDTGSGDLAAIATEWSDELRRYGEIMDLSPIKIGALEVLGARLGSPLGSPLRAAASADQSLAGPLDSPAEWPADWPAPLAAEIARMVLDYDPDRPAMGIRARLPRIGEWAGSRLRAKAESPRRIGPPEDARLDIMSRDEPYAHFFAVEHLRLRHRLYSGEWSQPIERALFIAGDATVVLPWDPIRDRVLLIDQFRPAPATRGDHEPWLYETVAGRIDRGETPEEAARREAVEEAGVTLHELIPGPHHYPSPGALAEMLYLFIGVADLPDGSTGIGGVESEGENIRSHLVSRAELAQMVRRGEIRNGPLLVLALWLELEGARLQARYTAS